MGGLKVCTRKSIDPRVCQDKTMKFFLSCVLILLSFNSVASPNNPSFEIDAMLSSLTKAGKFSGAVLIARDRKILLRKSYGFANLEKRIPFTPDTPHHVASISKMFTAMTVLKLRDQNILRLEASICTYLEHCPQIWQALTVEHLLRHTSGIPDYEEKLGLYKQAYLEFMTRSDASEKILLQARKDKLEFKPGTRFKYSNTGYVLLSSIVEKVSGRPFNQAVHDLVLEPAGLKNTVMFETGMTGISSGYTKNWKPIPKLALTPPAGDAALVSTMDNLYCWSELMDARENLEVFKPGLGGYGYGWFIDVRFGRKRYVHTGELPGYRTVFVKYPSKKLTVILFSNQDQSPMEMISRAIATRLLER
jgi:CubicO group peptidase (beta-lactamase class C family)